MTGGQAFAALRNPHVDASLSVTNDLLAMVMPSR